MPAATRVSVYLEDKYWLPQSLWRISASLEGVTLEAATDLRDDFNGAALRRLAGVSNSAKHARSLLALAEI